MITFSKEQILQLQNMLIDRYGGIHGIRDEGLLDSALNAPFQSFGGEDLFPSVTEKAVRLGYGLVQNHPFKDGNKRIGALAMLMLLDLNHINLKAGSSEVEEIILSVAAGQIDESGLLTWVMEKLI